MLPKIRKTNSTKLFAGEKKAIMVCNNVMLRIPKKEVKTKL